MIMDIETEKERADFQQMYESTFRLFIGAANHMLGNIEDAEDIVYAVYEKLAASYGRYKKKPLDQMKRLGVTMVKNQCINLLRRRKIMEIPMDEETLPENVFIDPKTDILEDIIKKERYEELKTAVEKLDEEDRIILTYRYDGRMKIARIAEEIGVSEKHIEYRIAKIKAILRDSLEENEGR